MSEFAPHVERLAAVTVTPSGSKIIFGGSRDAAASSTLHVLRYPSFEAESAREFSAAVTALHCLEEDIIAVGLSTGALELVSASGASSFQDERAHTGAITAIASQGDLVATVGEDGTLRVWKRSGGSLTAFATRPFGARPLRAVAFGPAGRWLAAAGDAGIVHALRTEALTNGGALRDMSMDVGVGALLLTPDGRVVAGGADGSVRIAFLEGAPDAENRSKGAEHERAVRSLVLGPQLTDEARRPLPRRLYSVAEDGTLKAWDLESRRRPKTEDIGGESRQMVWIPAPTNAPDAARAGGLAIVSHSRRVSIVSLGPDGALGGKKTLKSRIAQLASDLKKGNAKVRAATIDALARLPEDEARRLLERTLQNDREAELRAKAATKIANSGRRRSRPALRQALNDGKPEVRKAVLDALTSLEKDNPFSAARAALVSKHADMRIVALARLPMLRSASPLVPGLIAQRLKDGDAKVRLAALDALYTLEGKESVEPVRIAFARGTPDIRNEAIIRLSAAGLAGGEGAELVELALDDEAETVRETAFLAAIGARAGIAAALGGDPVFATKLATFKEAGGRVESGAAEASEVDRQPLFASLTARHVDTAVRGAWALAVLADPRAIGALLQLSRDGSASVRRNVIVLAQHAIKGKVPGAAQLRGRIEWLLNDTDTNVRASAFDALAFLEAEAGAAGEMRVAELALRSVYNEIRLRALQLLVKFGGEGAHAGERELAKRADDLLGDALDDEHSKVREEAFRTLWAWHSASPEPALTRAAASRHADLRKRMVGELARLTDQPWADALLLTLAKDASESVGLAAYAALLDVEANKTRKEVHEAALSSPSPKVIARACATINASAFLDLRGRLLDFLEDERIVVSKAALRAFDRLKPSDEAAFSRAFGSIFYELRTTAIELCGRRRDTRCIVPARALLALPETDSNRPSPKLRQRIARALADVGHGSLIPFFVNLLSDTDGLVREYAARGIATAARPGHAQPLVDNLAHEDLAVRSWLAEGLARLGDPRALPVLAGTLGHDHRPIRLGAIMGFAALGPEGTRGLLMGLDDADREIQDLVFAAIVARDIALAEKGLAPDLLLSALSSTHPEVRFAAARFIEARMAGDVRQAARELVGPIKPSKAADMEKWPEEADRDALQDILVRALSSDDPPLRYAATQVLALRPKADAYWREIKRLQGPVPAGALRIPHTNWADENATPRKRGWMRTLVQGLDASGDASLRQLIFGVYAGLVRQAPTGDADETHRIRRDALGRIQALATHVGESAALPVIRRGLDDPHHLVRKAAVTALKQLHADGDKTPLTLMLRARAADVGKAAVDELIAAAPNDNAAKDLAVGALEAPNADVRSHALGRLPSLYEQGSLEPFLIALRSRFSDVRLAVVNRLVGSQDDRVADALGKAMESEHEDLQLRAAEVLAARGDRRTLDILAGMLRSENAKVVGDAGQALVRLSQSNDVPESARSDLRADVAAAFIARMEDDPDGTANKKVILDSLGRVGSTAALPALMSLLTGEDANLRRQALRTAIAIGSFGRAARVSDKGIKRASYDEAFVLSAIEVASSSVDAALRLDSVAPLQDIDDASADALLAALVDDRDEQVRIKAVRVLAHRSQHAPEPKPATETLAAVLREGKRELVLPAAQGLAKQGRREAFQPLVLVLKAGENPERQAAVLSLGNLGDPRGLEELEPLAFPSEELEPEDKLLVPFAVEALGRMIPRLEGEEQTRVRDAIETTAKESSPGMRMRALSGLAAAGNERSRALLRQLLGDRYEENSVRIHCAKMLGELTDSDSEEVLADALRVNNHQLRQQALKSLRGIFPQDETRVSLLALQSPYSDISAPAAQFLAREGDADTLITRLADIKNPDVRIRLRKGLIRRGLAPVAAIAKLLETAPAGPRTDAAWLAFETKAPELAAPLRVALERCVKELQEVGKESEAERVGATRAVLAAGVRLEANLDPARELLTHRVLGGEAFAALLERGAISDDELVAALSAPQFRQRWIAARALAAKSPERSAAILQSLAAPSASGVAPLAKAAVAHDAAQVLSDAKLRGIALPTMLQDARSPLVDRALAKDSEGREIAIAALGRAGDQDAVDALKSILARPDEADEIRAAAYKALRKVERRRARNARFEEEQA